MDSTGANGDNEQMAKTVEHLRTGVGLPVVAAKEGRAALSPISAGLAIFALATQVLAFLIKIGPEMTWRPFVFGIELVASVATVYFSRTIRVRWPLVLLAIWHLLVAAAIWVAGLEFLTVEWIDTTRNPNVIEGPNGWTRIASLGMVAGGAALATIARRQPRRQSNEYGETSNSLTRPSFRRIQ